MMIKSSKKIKKVVLLTTKNEVNCFKSPFYPQKNLQLRICIKKNVLYFEQSATNNQQESRFEEIKVALAKLEIAFLVKYNSALHDREITLSNGWIIKIGRGLDYFQRPEQGGRFCMGMHDFDLRPCLATTVDIFHKSSTKVSNYDW